MAKRSKENGTGTGASGGKRLKLADLSALDREAIVVEVLTVVLENTDREGLGDQLCERDNSRALAAALGVPYLSIEMAYSDNVVTPEDIEQWRYFGEREQAVAR